MPRVCVPHKSNADGSRVTHSAGKILASPLPANIHKTEIVSRVTTTYVRLDSGSVRAGKIHNPVSSKPRIYRLPIGIRAMQTTFR